MHQTKKYKYWPMLAVIGFLWAFPILCYSNPIPTWRQNSPGWKTCRQRHPVRVKLKAVVGVMVSENFMDLERIKAGPVAIAQFRFTECTRRAWSR